jgi:pimeloyl-ACP methyl ester carboxylesterase
MIRNLLALTIVVSLWMPPGASAEDRPTVFVHGLASNSHTWDQAVSRLTPLLAMQPFQVDLDWRALYETQAGQLQQQLGSLPGDVIAVGHSNGGVIARQWSRNRSVGGIITLASPNQGAPFVDHIFEWFTFLDDVLNRMANVSAAFSVTSHDVWWWVPDRWLDSFKFATDVWNTAGNGLFSLGFDYRLPVMPEMRVFSSYMTNLNSQATRDSEASRVTNRVTLLNVARDFDLGGPFRVVAPGNYVAWHNTIVIAGIGLDALAQYIRITAEVQDQSAFDLADQISSVAEWFLQFEEVWCLTVSDPSPYSLGSCYEHDGIVPAWSQAYDVPRLPFLVRDQGPIHTQETSESDDQLYQALTTVAGVAERDPTAPPPTFGPPPSENPPPPPPAPPTGRYKIIGSECVWDANDSGPDQCSPLPPPGRYKFDGFGTCYWEPNDYPPDQCSLPAAPTGRFKLDGSGGCSWDPNDSGPDQCAP